MKKDIFPIAKFNFFTKQINKCDNSLGKNQNVVHNDHQYHSLQSNNSINFIFLNNNIDILEDLQLLPYLNWLQLQLIEIDELLLLNLHFLTKH